MPKRSPPYSVLMPAIVCGCSLLYFFTTAESLYISYKLAAHGSGKIFIGNDIVLQPRNFVTFSFTSAAWSTDRPITTLNEPALFAEPLFSLLLFRKTSFLYSIMMEKWRCITYPLLALPAWWFVGSAVDGLLNRRRIGRNSMVISLVLAAIFLSIAAGLRFGSTAEERQEQVLLPSRIEGLFLWGFLFLLPSVAWLRQYRRRSRHALPAE